MKMVAITDFLTEAELRQAWALWGTLRGTGTFAATVDREIIAPHLARINEALGQVNDARYLAYAVEYVFTAEDRRQRS